MAAPPVAVVLNAPLHPEVLIRAREDSQLALALATEGCLRYVWESRFGPILIEVAKGEVFVNGSRVEPAPSA